MFQDVNVKFQVHLYLKLDVDVLKHAIILGIDTNLKAFFQWIAFITK